MLKQCKVDPTRECDWAECHDPMGVDCRWEAELEVRRIKDRQQRRNPEPSLGFHIGRILGKLDEVIRLLKKQERV